jgi:hypothetical protein
MDLVDKYLGESSIKPIGKPQQVIYNYLEALDKNYGHPYNMEIDLNQIAKHPDARGIHYGKLQNAAKALAKKGYIEFDGFNKIIAFLNPKYK